ncbi:HAD-like domain-containing protein [Phyllosticta paracitricarpa]|uniref:2-hydroxy-3-keto-5-methylthiopentenyl-1-phosphate phosphatase-like protein n=1 Tax=Phyllosticta paracitricarpa TaxID=2016321 RepID=A0ABR1N1J8_9PEZI
MAAPDLPAMKTNPQFIFFTDYDGTITESDSNDFMTDTIGFGYDLRRKGNMDTLEGKKTFRESFKEMMDSVKKPYNECIEYLLQNIKLDPGFNDFFKWSLENNIPVVVLSSGMEPIIKALLAKLVGPESEKIQVVANNVQARPGKSINDEGGWELVFHDESGFGHDKSRTLRPYAQLPPDQRPTMFYAGDGVSDLSAARETDLLFAKKGHDLIKFCVREDIPFTVFESWKDIHAVCKKIVEGKKSVQEAATEGYQQFKSGEAGVSGSANGAAK